MVMKVQFIFYLRYGSWQRQVRGEAGVAAEDSHQGLVTQLKSVGLPAEAGVFQPRSLVVSWLEDE